MKKLSFLFAMMLVASMVYAQKTTWVTQSGNSNVANISQSSTYAETMYDLNAIYAVQSGTSNYLETYQKGQNNYISLQQTDPGTSNRAVMTQLTIDAITPGGLNNADIVQSGNSNNANLTQKEDQVNTPLNQDYSHNTVHATQSGDGNVYVLAQGGIPWQPINNQFLTQSGNGNSANVGQIGYENYSEINQSGNNNYGKLKQNDAAMNSPVIWDKSYSWQTGQQNLLDISQNGNPGLQLANSYQNGMSNTTNINQLSWNEEQVISQQLGTGDVLNVHQDN